MAEKGFIFLYRKLRENTLWQEDRVFSKAEAWIDMLLEVRWKKGDPSQVVIGNKTHECGLGQSLKSTVTWARRWRWSRKKVRTFFRILESMGMIKVEILPKVSTRITICNYDSYQSTNGDDAHQMPIICPSDAHQMPIKCQSDAHQMPTEEEGKEGKEREEEKTIALIKLENDSDEILKAYSSKVKSKGLDNSGSTKKFKETITNLMNSGVSKERLLRCVDNYSKHCRRTQPDEKFRKGFQTFFGPKNQLWRDYDREDLGPDYSGAGAGITPNQRLAQELADDLEGLD